MSGSPRKVHANGLSTNETVLLAIVIVTASVIVLLNSRNHIRDTSLWGVVSYMVIGICVGIWVAIDRRSAQRFKRGIVTAQPLKPVAHGPGNVVALAGKLSKKVKPASRSRVLQKT